MEKYTTLISEQSFHILSASRVSHSGEQVRRVSPSECSFSGIPLRKSLISQFLHKVMEICETIYEILLLIQSVKGIS